VIVSYEVLFGIASHLQ